MNFIFCERKRTTSEALKVVAHEWPNPLAFEIDGVSHRFFYISDGSTFEWSEFAEENVLVLFHPGNIPNCEWYNVRNAWIEYWRDEGWAGLFDRGNVVGYSVHRPDFDKWAYDAAHFRVMLGSASPNQKMAEAVIGQYADARRWWQRRRVVALLQEMVAELHTEPPAMADAKMKAAALNRRLERILEVCSMLPKPAQRAVGAIQTAMTKWQRNPGDKSAECNLIDRLDAMRGTLPVH